VVVPEVLTTPAPLVTNAHKILISVGRHTVVHAASLVSCLFVDLDKLARRL
jgi:hypothetical protein